MRYPSLWRLLREFGRPWKKVIVLAVLAMGINGYLDVKAMDRTIPVFDQLFGNALFAKFEQGKAAEVDEEKCDSCSLCTLNCPVPGCITWKRVKK